VLNEPGASDFGGHAEAFLDKTSSPAMSPNDDLFQQADYARTIFEMVPIPILIVDQDMQILDCNPAASGFLGADRLQTHLRRGGEALRCIHSTEVPGGCGHAEACAESSEAPAGCLALPSQPSQRWKSRTIRRHLLDRVWGHICCTWFGRFEETSL